ncbi:hypothetical protein A9Q79_10190 [Methylophaga sp. 42_25_T18]|nr:hypothetical protein A9Q79_10190 [Methylophaga sp. 42_25_T18]
MHIIVYISEYTGRDEDIEADLADITQLAQINNVEAQITGLLFYHDRHFLQVIEAEQVTLANLMDVLAKDPRHKNIERIVDETIPARSFSDWHMASFNLSDDEPLVPEEIKKITELFKDNVSIASAGGDLLVGFYQSMLTKTL